MPEVKNDVKAAALAYDPAVDGVPRMVAKGRGAVARRIVALAEENGIPVKKDDDLADLLDALDVEMDIPPALYQAVAEVLVFIYRMNGLLVPKTGAAPPGPPA
jgi:flagellar biosynthesis protein